MKTLNAPTAADKARRAGERLAEARQHAAEIAEEIAGHQRSLSLASTMVNSAERDVTAAEQAATRSASALVDHRAEHLIAAGSEDEAPAQAKLDASQQTHQAALDRLDQARSTHAAAQERLATESASVQGKISEAQAKQREVTRLIASLDRQHKQATAQAAQEAADAAKMRILRKYLDLWDEIAQDVGVLGEHTSTLPRTLLPVELTTEVTSKTLTVLTNIMRNHSGSISNITRYAKAELASLEALQQKASEQISR